MRITFYFQWYEQKQKATRRHVVGQLEKRSNSIRFTMMIRMSRLSDETESPISRNVKQRTELVLRGLIALGLGGMNRFARIFRPVYPGIRNAGVGVLPYPLQRCRRSTLECVSTPNSAKRGPARKRSGSVYFGKSAIYHSTTQDPITFIKHDRLAWRNCPLWRLELHYGSIAFRYDGCRDICTVIPDARLNACATIRSNSRYPFHAASGKPVTQKLLGVPDSYTALVRVNVCHE
jgi:hypothetical protein